MGQPVWCLSSCCPVQRIDNIKPPIHEKQFEILLFLEISLFASRDAGRGVTVSHLTRSTPEGVQITRGDRGAGEQRGGDAVEDV